MTNNYALIGLVVVGVYAILQMASIIISIWSKLRRQPPIDQTLKEYTLKKDFDKHVENNNAAFGNLYDLQRTATEKVGDQIRDMNSNLSTWQHGVSHQIGKLEGQISSIENSKK